MHAKTNNKKKSPTIKKSIKLPMTIIEKKKLRKTQVYKEKNYLLGLQECTKPLVLHYSTSDFLIPFSYINIRIQTPPLLTKGEGRKHFWHLIYFFLFVICFKLP